MEDGDEDVLVVPNNYENLMTGTNITDNSDVATKKDRSASQRTSASLTGVTRSETIETGSRTVHISKQQRKSSGEARKKDQTSTNNVGSLIRCNWCEKVVPKISSCFVCVFFLCRLN